MPRIKGWRKIRKDEWKSNENYKIKIEKRPSNDYSIVLYRPDGVGRTLNYNIIDTKKQALKYARNWMKRHPRG